MKDTKAPVQALPDQPEVQEAVARLCTAWWQAGALSKESLVAQTLPYLLVRALSTGVSLLLPTDHAPPRAGSRVLRPQKWPGDAGVLFTKPAVQRFAFGCHVCAGTHKGGPSRGHRHGPEQTCATVHCCAYFVKEKFTSAACICNAHAGKAADVKRCHAMRAALPLLDFDDDATSDFKRFLLRASFAPAFLRCPEGRRFLSFLYTLQARLCRFMVIT